MEMLPINVLARKLLALYTPPQRSQSTYDTMARVLMHLARLEGVKTSADLTPETISKYVVTRSATVCANTIIGELGYVKAMCGWAEEEGYLERSPFRGRRRSSPTGWIRPEPPKDCQFHSREDIARVLLHMRRNARDWQGHRLYALTMLVAYTGLRRDEALYVQLRDVNLDTKILRVMGRRRLKTVAAAAPVPLCTELVETLREWIPNAGGTWLFPGTHGVGPWNSGGPGGKPLHRIKAAAEEVGVKGFTFQSLRHSWATHAESAWGLSGPLIQRVLRHTTEETSRRHYRHAELVNLANAVKDLSYLDGSRSYRVDLPWTGRHLPPPSPHFGTQPRA
ncbi:tyrosine-type recombinase/integrase [Singulisphaera sp. PoT]|uniref:tyrosine-type recombinase/integrase n=1 Tax=Singulisphaera sp. PoT TaxID=3411797 RepID=UPI003BF4BAC6